MNVPLRKIDACLGDALAERFHLKRGDRFFEDSRQGRGQVGIEPGGGRIGGAPARLEVRNQIASSPREPKDALARIVRARAHDHQAIFDHLRNGLRRGRLRDSRRGRDLAHRARVAIDQHAHDRRVARAIVEPGVGVSALDRAIEELDEVSQLCSETLAHEIYYNLYNARWI